MFTYYTGFKVNSGEYKVMDIADWFEMNTDSPTCGWWLMFRKKRASMTAEQQKLFGIEKLNVPRSQISAATYADYSARVAAGINHYKFENGV